MTAKIQFKIALYFFAAIALYGLILRTVPVYPLPIKYSNFLHAHSHVAFLGWLHGGFIAFVSFVFLKDKLNTTFFKFIYLFTIANIVGMYFSFPLQGYKFFSILFLSLFLIGTYLFTHYFFKHKTGENKFPATYKFIKAGLWLQILSSISPWSLGAIIKILGKDSVFYKYDIFYYLHFQYNGWFLFATIGLTLYLLERRNITLPVSQIKRLYQMMLLAVFLGYFSNTLWAKPGVFFNFLALLGSTAEIWGYIILLQILNRYHRYLKSTISDFSYSILRIVLFVFMLKATLQWMGSIQYYADLSYQIRDFVIGYLHLIMLGIFTPFLLVMAFELGFISLKKSFFLVFYSGFLLTESLVFLRAVLTWFTISFNQFVFNMLLWLCTLVLMTGVWLIAFSKSSENEKI